MSQDIEAVVVQTGMRSGGMRNEFLSFKLGREEYGIDILKVQEIRGFEAPTRIANAPSYILGVQNLRGVIVPIVDMRIKFRTVHFAYDAQTVTIVLRLGNQIIGMVVDSVSDVVALQAGQIKPAPEFSENTVTDYIIGIGSIESDQGKRMLILVNIERLMNGAEMCLATQSIQ